MQPAITEAAPIARGSTDATSVARRAGAPTHETVSTDGPSAAPAPSVDPAARLSPQG